MTTRDDFGISEVIRHLAARGGGGFEWYKDSCLLRRIEVRMRARGMGTVAGYAALLRDDPGEVDRLLHTLSVRVTEFFRNPDTWHRLSAVLAEAGVGAQGRITAWSMGCATGEEAWTLAMLLLDHAARQGGQPSPEGIHVFASDVDTEGIRTAQNGRYPAAAATVVRQVVGPGYGTVVDEEFRVDESVRQRVVFRREDLTASRPPAGWCDVVCCRNVLIFLGREGQRRVLDIAIDALRPGGLLVLGRTESLIAQPRAALEHVDVTHRIFRRIG
ncbi:MAG: CheR family methyltransferase [Gemmatimonadales bacterium]